jgi:FHA domain
VATCPSGHQSASDDFCEVCGVLIGAAPSLGPGVDPDAGPAGSGVAGATMAGPAPWPAEPCPRCGTARAGQFCEVCGYNFAAPASSTGSSTGQAPPASPPPASPPSPNPPPANAQVTSAQVTYDPWPSVSVPAGPVPGSSRPVVQPAPPAAQPAPPAAQPAPPAGGAWTAVVSADRAYFESVQASADGPDAAGIEFPAYCPQRRFPLDRAEVRIGRHSASSGITPEIDLSVPPADPGISRLHAVLLRAADGGWAIIDPGSANGTLLNGAELPSGQLVPVRDGDRIHLGAWTELRLTTGA